MPRQPYPRSRRIYMQAVLCAIFFGSVALAELVSRQHSAGGVAVKAESVDFGRGILKRVYLPVGWVMKFRRDGLGPTVFVDQEPDTPDHPGRSITCRVEQLPTGIPPLEYLQTGDILDENSRILKTNSGAGYEELTMGGAAGVLLETARQTLGESQNQWIACCVLPAGQAVTLVMDCPPGGDPDDDRQMIHDIASSVEFRR